MNKNDKITADILHDLEKYPESMKYEFNTKETRDIIKYEFSKHLSHNENITDDFIVKIDEENNNCFAVDNNIFNIDISVKIKSSSEKININWSFLNNISIQKENTI
jgi:hypothetical protein